MDNGQCVAIITARGGSKGLPRKNVLELAGKPMIAHTIIAAIDSGCFDRVIVTTDCKEIKRVSLDWGAEIIDRPAELAGDSASSLDVVRHTLQEVQLTSGSFCLLQPTSPLRKAHHIQEASKIFSKPKVTSVISAVEIHHPYKSLLLNSEGCYYPTRYLSDLTSPRQKLPKSITPNGALYLCDTKKFIDNYCMIFSDTKYYLMNKLESIDVDDYFDFTLASNFILSDCL